jgi:BirA family transcriptional regulator, biotin operon repressor / biotin---[acetyl-CoA-carboxylase] ligase
MGIESDNPGRRGGVRGGGVVTAFGRPHRHYRVTDSTNERARELAAGGAPSGTVVTAAEQREGRGRRGRRWSAPAGSALLYSAVLRPLERRHALLPLAVPLAVCGAVESLAPQACRVKWPNDVWVDERKVAGILIEARPHDWAVIGVGVNLQIAEDEFPDDLRWPATSVGHGATVDGALAAVNDALGEWFQAPRERVLAEFRARDALAGREVAWEGAGDAGQGRGVAAGIDDAGNLIVTTEANERLSLGAGEVSLRPNG